LRLRASTFFAIVPRLDLSQNDSINNAGPEQTRHLHFGDWGDRLVIEAMANCKMFIHVMDLNEFLQFIGF